MAMEYNSYILYVYNLSFSSIFITKFVKQEPIRYTYRLFSYHYRRCLVSFSVYSIEKYLINLIKNQSLKLLTKTSYFTKKCFSFFNKNLKLLIKKKKIKVFYSYLCDIYY